MPKIEFTNILVDSGLPEFQRRPTDDHVEGLVWGAQVEHLKTLLLERSGISFEKSFIGGNTAVKLMEAHKAQEPKVKKAITKPDGHPDMDKLTFIVLQDENKAAWEKAKSDERALKAAIDKNLGRQIS